MTLKDSLPASRRTFLKAASLAPAAVVAALGAESSTPANRESARVPARMKLTRSGKVIAPVIDIFPQLAAVLHDEAMVADQMKLLRGFGFNRVYFVLCNPGYPMFSHPRIMLQPPHVQGLENHAFESIRALGDPNFVYALQCRRHGMEAFAVIKPYEGGGGTTVPHGAKISLETFRETTIGGDRIAFDHLLSVRPDLRVKRRPIPGYEQLLAQPVEAISIDFCLDAIAGVNPARMPDGGDVKYRLFTSRDNGEYTPYAGRLSVSEAIERKVLRDPNGTLLDSAPKRCRVVTLSGFAIPTDTTYLAVAIESATRLYTIPQSMIRLHGPRGEIPATATAYVRQPGNTVESNRPPKERTWGMEDHPQIAANVSDAIEQFCGWGFEFEWYGTGFWGVGWQKACAYGIAKGKLEWMKGTPCEAEPAVTDYWLNWIERIVAMGFDGVDVRLQNHSGMVSDYANFGYNAPLVVAYRKKHGVDILTEAADPLKLMGVRGDFFIGFLERAAELLHAAGRKLQVHLRHCHQEPKLSPEFNQLGFWAMPKVWLEDWRRVVELADEITLKDYQFNNYRSEVALEIKKFARRQGKRVWVHCYLIQSGRELNPEYFRRVEQDADVGGVLLYEATSSATPHLGLINHAGPIQLNPSVAEMLRKIMAESEYR